MKPKFVRLQALAVLLVTAVGVGLLGPGADLAAGIEITVGAAIWLWFSRRRLPTPRLPPAASIPWSRHCGTASRS